MKNKKTEFQVTVGYKAVVAFGIKPENEEEAKKIVLDRIKKDGVTSKSDIQYETYSVSGVLNMDTSWNIVNS